MLTLISEPNKLSFTGDFNCYRLKAMENVSTPYAAQGINGRIVFQSIDPTPYFQTGEQFSIAWDTGMENYTVSFVAVANQSTENEVQDNSWDGLPTDYFAAITAKLAAHPLISTYFDVTQGGGLGGTIIYLRAREVDEAWSITMNKGSVSKASIDFQEDNTIKKDNTPANYKVRFEVFFQKEYGTGGYDRVVCSEAVPNAMGELYFDVGQILHQEFLNSYEPQLLSASANEIVIADNRRQYYVRYAEEFGEPSELQAWTTLSTRKVIAGRVDSIQRNDQDFAERFNANNAFFSFLPKRKTIDRKQAEFLHWFNFRESSQAIALEVIETDATYTDTTKYIYVSSSAIEAGATAEIPVGTEALSIAATTLKYRVRVVEQANTAAYLSQARNFYFDQVLHQDTRYMAYLNSFSLPETLRLTGETTKRVSVDRVLSERVLNCQTNNQLGVFQHDFDFRNEYVWRTGFLSKDETDALQELLIYNQAYELQEDGYIAILITDNEFPITQTFQFLHSLEMTGIRSLRQTSYYDSIIFEGNVGGDGGGGSTEEQTYELRHRKETFMIGNAYSAGQVITLANIPDRESGVMIYRNKNQKLREGTHYTISNRTITFLFGSTTPTQVDPDLYEVYYQTEDSEQQIAGFDYKRVEYNAVYGPADTVTLDHVPAVDSVFIVKNDGVILQQGVDYETSGTNLMWKFAGVAGDVFRIWSAYEGTPKLLQGYLNYVFFLNSYSSGTNIDLQVAPLPNSLIINWDSQDTVITLEEGVHYTVSGNVVSLLFSDDPAYFDLRYAA